MLSLAPKGRIAPARLLSPGDDRLLREAFGRYGGTAAARADAVDVVRRAQIEAGGSWFLCDCRPGLERPPALVPVLETYLRRHTQAGWPLHAEACEFFREPAEQAKITASYAPLPRPRVRLVRAFERGATEPVLCLEPASAARRSQLARLLMTLMDQAGLQRIGSIGRWPPQLPEQLRRLWPVARAIFVDRGVALSDVLCLSLAGLPALMEKIATAGPDAFPRTRPHGLLLLRLADARAGELVALNGQVLRVVGRVAAFGEAPEDEPDAPGARAPYLALCLVARPSPNDSVQICAAYAHPCASADRLLLVDSNLERGTLDLLLAFRVRMAARSGIAIAIEKPLHDLAPPRAAGAPAGPPLIPDFVVSAASAEGGVRRAVVETMGYRDAGYRERKLRLHPLMQAAAGASVLIEHDFHAPAHWPQEWRDNRLGRELWKSLIGPGAEGAGQGSTQVPETTTMRPATAPSAPPPA